MSRYYDDEDDFGYGRRGGGGGGEPREVRRAGFDERGRGEEAADYRPREHPRGPREYEEETRRERSAPAEKVDERHLWGEEKVKATLEAFRAIRFVLPKNGVPIEVLGYLRHPRNEKHVTTQGATFAVPLGQGLRDVPLGFVFRKTDSELHKFMEEEMAKMADGKKGHWAVVQQDAVMVQRLRVRKTRATTLAPMEVNISGVSDEYTNPHYVSWDPEGRCLTTIYDGFEGEVFRNNSSNTSDLPSIHGMHDIEADNLKGVAAWGDTRNDVVLVDVFSGRFLWLMTNFVHLVEDYAKTNKDMLPQGVSEEAWTAIKAWAREVPPPRIYSASTPLDDNYIGELAEYINPNGGARDGGKKEVFWTMDDVGMFYRVPKTFMEFAVTKYRDITAPVILARPNKMKMSVKPVVPPIPGFKFGEADFVLFSSEADLSRPGCYWTARELPPT